MQRIIHGTEQRAERPDVDAFVTEVLELYRRHGKAIGYDRHGLLVVEPYSHYAAQCLMDAQVRDETPHL
jgi:hypothetical protein